MNRLVLSICMCVSAVPGFAMGAAERIPHESFVNNEELSLIWNAVVLDNVQEVCRVADILYDTEGANVIQILNGMLRKLGIENSAVRALRSWMAGLQRAEVPVVHQRAVSIDPGLIFAQRILDVIEVNDSDGLRDILEAMVWEIDLVPSLNIINIMIKNLAQERLARTEAYTTLKSCFALLNPQIDIQIPVPVVPRHEQVARRAPAQAPVVMLEEKVGAVQDPLSQENILKQKRVLRPVTPAAKVVVPVAHPFQAIRLRPVKPQGRSQDSRHLPPVPESQLLPHPDAKPVSKPCVQNVQQPLPQLPSKPADAAPALPTRHLPRKTVEHQAPGQEVQALDGTVLLARVLQNKAACQKDQADSHELPDPVWDDTSASNDASTSASYAGIVPGASQPYSVTPEDVEHMRIQAASITAAIQDTLKQRRESMKEDAEEEDEGSDSATGWDE